MRPLMGEHWINPVLYAEFEDTSADKTLREVVGHDGNDDMMIPNGIARADKEREMELKLILGSNVRGWNISENFITEKESAERRALGIRLRLWHQSPAEARGQRTGMHFLCREIPGRRGDVRRPG